MAQTILDTPAFKAADAYERFFVSGIFRYWTPRLLERAEPKPGQQVLDVACGTGVVARSVAPIVQPGGQVIGLDINTAMLEVACRQFSEHCDLVEWREGRAESLPFQSQSFDLVTCQQGLQFFSDKAQAAREMARVLRPGGRAVIEVWQPVERHPVYQSIFETISSTFLVPVNEISTAFAFSDAQALHDLFVDAGFRTVRVDSVTEMVYFPQPERFVEQTIKGAAAVIPAFARLDRSMQSDLLVEVNHKINGTLRSQIRDGVLSFPMHGNIAVAIEP